MKKIIALALALILALSIMGCSKNKEDASENAEEELIIEDVLTYGDFEYAVNEDGDFEIVGYTYSGAAQTAVEIPASIDGRPVTGIGKDAFKAITSMNAVTIPSSIEYIDDFAFYGCTSLTSVVIPDSVTYIGTGAFWGCSEVTTVTLSKALKTLGDYAFWNCSKVAAIELPETLETIGEGAFWNCMAITSVTVPASVKKVGRGAFIYCEALTVAEFKSAEVEIGEGAFDYCPEAFKLVGVSADSTVKTFADAEGITFEVAPKAE